MSEEPPPPPHTFRTHPLARLYVGLVLPALGMLLVAIPGSDALGAGDGRGIAASALGLVLVAALTLRFNRRAFWTVTFQSGDLDYLGASDGYGCRTARWL